MLRHAGKKESAIRVYRQALRIACGNDLWSGFEATFNDEPNVRRYLLPGETTARAIVRELITDADWTFQDWSEASPKNTVAILAAVTSPRTRAAGGSIAAQTDSQPGARDCINRRGTGHPDRNESPKPTPCCPSGERPSNSIIKQSTGLVISRSSGPGGSTWRSAVLQLNDEVQRKVALEAALEAPTSDDICRKGRFQPAGACRNLWPTPIQRDQGQLRSTKDRYSRADPRNEQPWR